MHDGAKKGIDIDEDLLSELSWHCAGGSHSAHALRRVLKFGHPQPESGAGGYGDSGFLLRPTTHGWCLAALSEPDVFGAWLRPFNEAEVDARRWSGALVDDRGSVADDPRKGWIRRGMVDVFNAEVTILGPIDWPG